jgi:hypothetical protein
MTLAASLWRIMPLLIVMPTVLLLTAACGDDAAEPGLLFRESSPYSHAEQLGRVEQLATRIRVGMTRTSVEQIIWASGGHGDGGWEPYVGTEYYFHPEVKMLVPYRRVGLPRAHPNPSADGRRTLPPDESPEDVVSGLPQIFKQGLHED